MDDYRCELTEVQRELREVSCQIEALLERQSSLSERKQDLEAILQQHEAVQAEADKAVSWDVTNFPWSKELQSKLREAFGLSSLRPMQLQTMNATLSAKDCLLIMPTGGGKSLCFQLPATLSKGVTLVVSPLISLMEDQLMGLEGTAVNAALLCASTDKSEVKRLTDGLTDKKSPLQLMYVTPEKLAKSKRFMTKLQKMYEMGRFARLVIDEVHCCSQWGHDFRPDYKFLGIMKRQFPTVPILGLTATATTKVLNDVKNILNIPQCLVFRASFNRPNLYFEVRPKPSSQKETIDAIAQLIKSKFNGQSGIIYCFTRKDSEDVARELQSRGIRAGCYHAYMNAQERRQVHKHWTTNRTQVVVATVAFGMGIDKPDVRFVIHHSLSKSMENLYQEAGRAGRDDKKASCVVFYRLADVFRQSTMVFTEQTGMDNLYGIMSYCTDVSRCRRSMIARHFGEVWEASQCKGMCDHCHPDRRKETNMRGVTRLCMDLLRIVEQASATQQRITGQKLIDAWFHRGDTKLQMKTLSAPGISNERAERIVATLLLQGYLREDYHFTPYNTICYVVLGPKASQLLGGLATVSMEFESRQQPQGSKTAPNPASATPASSSKASQHAPSSSRLQEDQEPADSPRKRPSSQSRSDSSAGKPRLVIVNRENSAVTAMALGSLAGGDQCGNGAAKTAVDRTKKRVISDDSDCDLEGLEFDEAPLVAHPVRKRRKAASSPLPSSSTALNGHVSKTICIEDSSNSE